jgi:anti-sigma factor RsiW
VNEPTICDRVRLQLMAVADGESDRPSAADEEHLTTCSACRQWRHELEAMSAQLGALPYRSAEIDLWAAVQDGIQRRESGWSLTHRLTAIGGLVLAWRALQLFVDLPVPLLHPLVPIAAAIAVVWQVWQVAGDPLGIETFAPELQKRGV